VGGMGFLKLISQAFPRPLPQSPLVFPALSLALVFARAPLSERLEQAMVCNLHNLEILVFQSGATVFKPSGRTILFYYNQDQVFILP